VRLLTVTLLIAFLSSGCNGESADEQGSDLAKTAASNAAMVLDREVRSLAAMSAEADLSQIDAKETSFFIHLAERGDYPSGLVVRVQGRDGGPETVWDGERVAASIENLAGTTEMFEVTAGGYSVCAVLGQSAADEAAISDPVKGSSSCSW
jgi:hypothetical protein